MSSVDVTFTPVSGIASVSSIFDPAPSVVKQPLFFAAGLKAKRATVLERGIYEELLRQPVRDSQLCMGEAIHSHRFRGSNKAPKPCPLRKTKPAGRSTSSNFSGSSSSTRSRAGGVGNKTFAQLLKQPCRDQELCMGEAIHKYNHNGRGLEKRVDAEFYKKGETQRRRKEYGNQFRGGPRKAEEQPAEEPALPCGEL
jgi:hypothetical protein